jgi:hypothetical protein
LAGELSPVLRIFNGTGGDRKREADDARTHWPSPSLSTAPKQDVKPLFSFDTPAQPPRLLFSLAFQLLHFTEDAGFFFSVHRKCIFVHVAFASLQLYNGIQRNRILAVIPPFFLLFCFFFIKETKQFWLFAGLRLVRTHTSFLPPSSHGQVPQCDSSLAYLADESGVAALLVCRTYTLS